MNPKPNDLLMRNGVFARIALATGLILLIPLVAMRFTDEVNWDLADFIVMGILLAGTGSLFVFVSRKLSRRRRIAAGILFAAALVFIWAELAVGIFTDLGH